MGGSRQAIRQSRTETRRGQLCRAGAPAERTRAGGNRSLDHSKAQSRHVRRNVLPGNDEIYRSGTGQSRRSMMPAWAKIVAGCLALMIGASAPPLILLLLNPPSPSSRESRYERYSAAEQEHRDGDAAQRDAQGSSSGIPSQQPQHQDAIAAQAKHKSEGDSGAEWWVA